MIPEKKTTQPERQEIPVINADPQMGLTAQQASSREQGGWANGMPKSAAKTEKEIILENFLTFFNLVFAVLAVILILVGSSVWKMTFLVAVLCNTVIGCYQEIRAKRAVDKLTLVAAQQVRTIRDGKTEKVRSDLLVRDDIVEFLSGDQICADAILRTGEIQVNEALVTGEEDAVVKRPGDELKSGSFVVAGMGRAQLTRVGGDSFASRLALEAKANPSAAKSEMMRSLDKLIRVVGILLIPIGLALFYHEFQVLSESLRESTEGTVAALVGMIPQGLYLLTSMAMAVSSLRLAMKKVLVQDLNCIETLARVDVLCVDKTGTITESVMEVDNVIPLTADAPEHLEQVLAAIYSGVEPENDTARAMTEMFAGETDWECVRRIPFTSKTKWSAAVFRDRDAYIVGAPEFVMGSRYEELREEVEHWSAAGYRVLLIAEYAGEPQADSLIPGRLRPLACVLLSNRIRPEAPKTFSYFASQGVAIKVISGDNPVTVSEVARRAGIADAQKYIDANLLETDKDFLRAVDTYAVFGRVTPDKKKKLIQALKKKGHTVAMTGDGVNDVLAMKEADCGIAMASGAQAASQVAQLVLTKSDFAAMPGIVGEGRRVINNIQRAATLFLVKSLFSVVLSVITLFTAWEYPIDSFHLTMISTLTIGVPSFFLALEPNFERIRGRFLPGVIRKALPGSLTNIIVVLTAQALVSAYGLSSEQTETVCAAIMAVVGLLVLFQIYKPFTKFRKLIWAAMAAVIVLCFTFLKGLFGFELGDGNGLLVMVVLLVMTPTVFFALQWLFAWGDRFAAKLRAMKK